MSNTYDLSYFKDKWGNSVLVPQFETWNRNPAADPDNPTPILSQVRFHTLTTLVLYYHRYAFIL